ncbi:MAG: hypothetical protein LUD50_07915, partial [Clostridia bacterium]|nr:hypothetical protein [Clostridia bacterium]
KHGKALQNAKAGAEALLARRTDNVEDFDDMGVDALLVDEAHAYKHLGFATTMQRGVKGVDPKGSLRAQGLYLKTRSVMERTHGRNVVFATGTPISNTAAEVWTFMRYLMPPDVMEENGILHFDDFVRNFGNVSQMLEFGTKGDFKEQTRFSGYTNLPELCRLWSMVSDTVLTEEAVELQNKVPDLEGGKAQDIYVKKTAALGGIMDFVRSEIERFEHMTQSEKAENSHIPLVMYGVAKAAAVDPRLVSDTPLPYDPQSKTGEAVRQTLRSLEETKDYNGTVAIFAESYRNKRTGFNLFEDIKQRLVEAGVPEKQIVVMHPGKQEGKEDIFERMNRGEVRVALGSTATLGTGVNIQERLHTLIHLDAPDRPMDYTQRNGRILRQGNLHKEWGKPVRVLRLGVERTLDVTAYQRLQTKGRIVDSIMRGKKLLENNLENRTVDEEADDLGDIIGTLSGSKAVLALNQRKRDVQRLESRRKTYEATQRYAASREKELARQNKLTQERLGELRKGLEAAESSTGEGMTADGVDLGDEKKRADFLKERNKAVQEAQKKGSAFDETVRIKAGGHTFDVTTSLRKAFEGQGSSFSETLRRSVTVSCPELGIHSRQVRGALMRGALDFIEQEALTGKFHKDLIRSLENAVEANDRERDTLLDTLGKPFDKEEELEKARKEVSELEERAKQDMERIEAEEKADREQRRGQDVSVNVDSLADADTDEGEAEGDSTGARFRETDADAVAEAVDKDAGAAARNMAASLWADVEIANSIEEVTDPEARRAIEQGRHVTGWY